MRATASCVLYREPARRANVGNTLIVEMRQLPRMVYLSINMEHTSLQQAYNDPNHCYFPILG